MDTQTIVALATPPGRGGIGIVRLSGPQAFQIAGRLFASKAKGVHPFQGETFESHRMYYGQIFTPAPRRFVDEVLLVGMRAPRSYTREDIVEIQSHSGHAVLNRILELAVAEGARLADPGEFTRRAYMNGRIDLTQAEGVMDLINARTVKGLEVAATHVRGAMRAEVERLRDVCRNVIAAIEADSEFGSTDEIDSDGVAVFDRLEKILIVSLEKLLAHYEDAHVWRDGIRLAVVGRPNVGKSSLLNCLVRRERAIVTDTPGTTRDAIEAHVNINGIPALVTDTAGLRPTADPIELLGMAKTREVVGEADLILLLVDAHEGVTPLDLEIFNEIQHRPVILVYNKIDLIDPGDRRFPGNVFGHIAEVELSAKFNSGLSELKALIERLFLKEGRFDLQDALVPKLRHKKALERALEALRHAASDLRAGLPADVAVALIHDGFKSLGSITGATPDEDILDHVFNRFCIGK